MLVKNIYSFIIFFLFIKQVIGLKLLLFHNMPLLYHEWITKVFFVCIKKKRTDLKELLFKHWVFY
ncbi:hypothetical protein CLI71_08730 [Prevotella intermedia]|uniref:Uncharacterized protein n=1 Tax=Prevotella intermedia TaxID=28131 RepID=A0A2A6EE42_PREIN|nr:hypothetical protein CLI71_08730 [Prevotella intermedia]